MTGSAIQSGYTPDRYGSVFGTDRMQGFAKQAGLSPGQRTRTAAHPRQRPGLDLDGPASALPGRQ